MAYKDSDNQEVDGNGKPLLEPVAISVLNPDSLPALYEACKEFVRKCECGQARSVHSYAEMKAAIALAESRSK